MIGPDLAYLDAGSPHVHVAPAVLSSAAQHLTCMTAEGTQAVKTWLGLRYDRPAVPQRYLRLFQALSKQVRAKRHGQRVFFVRDVLVTFKEEGGRVLYDITAVLPPTRSSTVPAGVKDDLERWLAEVSIAVPTALGVAERLVVGTTEEVSFDLVETSYALDTSYVTWPASGGGPAGARRP